jgi:hypothetical protein
VVHTKRTIKEIAIIKVQDEIPAFARKVPAFAGMTGTPKVFYNTKIGDRRLYEITQPLITRALAVMPAKAGIPLMASN